jgi:hypothetical protein
MLDEIEVRTRVPTPAPADGAFLRAQAARLRRAGIEPIYVVPPVPWATPELFSVFSESDDPIVVALNSPVDFPALFALEHRYDAIHVNRAGAAEVSRALAARLAASDAR